MMCDGVNTGVPTVSGYTCTVRCLSLEVGHCVTDCISCKYSHQPGNWLHLQDSSQPEKNLRDSSGNSEVNPRNSTDMSCNCSLLVLLQGDWLLHMVHFLFKRKHLRSNNTTSSYVLYLIVFMSQKKTGTEFNRGNVTVTECLAWQQIIA